MTHPTSKSDRDRIRGNAARKRADLKVAQGVKACPVIVKFSEKTDHARNCALMAFRTAKAKQEWMYEFRWYRVTSVQIEGAELVIRGIMTRDGRNHPNLRGATFSDTEETIIG